MRTARLHHVLALALVVVGCSAGATDESAGGEPTAPAASSAAKPRPKPPVDSDPPATVKPHDPTTDPHAKPCTGNPGELYALTAKKLTSLDDIPLCRFRGNVLMIVNTASSCGFTPEYGPLQALYEKYVDAGFYVLGFPSRWYQQEFETDQEVTAFCTTNYHITFPMFTLGDINGDNAQPVYQWIHAQPGGPPANPPGSEPDGYARPVAWNFEKYLVSREGKIVLRVDPAVSPDVPEVVAAIEAEIAKE